MECVGSKMTRYLVPGVIASSVWLLVSGFQPSSAEVALEPGRWTRVPSPNEWAQCQPATTEIPAGSVRLMCRVEENGRLSQCVVLSSSHERLSGWGQCLSRHFVADPVLAGQEVPVALEWRRPV